VLAVIWPVTGAVALFVVGLIGLVLLALERDP